MLFLYENLLELPETKKSAQPDPVARKQVQAEQDLSIVNAIDRRLYSAMPLEDETPLKLQNPMKNVEQAVQPYRRVLARAHDIVSRVEAVRSSLVDDTVRQGFVPISVLSIPEYESLVRVCVSSILFLCRTLTHSDSGSCQGWRRCSAHFEHYEGMCYLCCDTFWLILSLAKWHYYS